MKTLVITARRLAASKIRHVGARLCRAITRTKDSLSATFSVGNLRGSFDELSGKVAGCGCTDDDAEQCATDSGGEYCECPCHAEHS